MTARPTFVGFGLGPIQAGLFLLEASRAGAFARLVVAEVDAHAVTALRAAGGAFAVNVATATGITAQRVPGVEIFNPRDPVDRTALVDAIAEAQELATALPSIAVYRSAAPDAAASVLADGLRAKAARGGPPAVIYTAENDNHAAEALDAALAAQGAPRDRVACLNTVIGKMSGVVTGDAEVRAQGLAPWVPGAPRAFLVETFNRILISRITFPNFTRGLSQFVEKADLLPFEEAKLYGHNAVHALLGYGLWRRGARHLADAAGDAALMRAARTAFLEESGAALCRKHAGVDPLFTPAGWQAYADDLLARMVNPFLRDAVARVTRDPRRKLGWKDRLVGTMRLAHGQGLAPHRFAVAARAAADMLGAEDPRPLAARLQAVWDPDHAPAGEAQLIRTWIEEAHDED